MRTAVLRTIAWSLTLACAAARAEDPAFDMMAEVRRGTPLSAAEAAERASREAPSVARAEALARAADAAIAAARVPLLPVLTLNARYAHIDGFPDGRIGPAASPEQRASARALAEQVDDDASRALWLSTIERQGEAQVITIPRAQLGLSARLGYPVSDLFFAVLPGIEAAEFAARARRADAAARTARVRLGAIEAYYHLARARGGLAVAQRAREQAGVQAERITAGVHAGIRTPADEASARARVAAAEQATVAAASSVDVADASLRSLLADEDETPYGLSEPLLDIPEEPTPASAQDLLTRARAQRAEVASLRALIQGQGNQEKVIVAGGYPHLSVYVGADYARPNRYLIPPSNRFQESWEAGVQLAYTPNDTLLAARRKSESRANVAALAAQLRELELALMLEVRSARAVLVRANESARAARAAHEAAEEAYARRMAELRAGEVTTADLFSAENDVNQARLAVLDAAVERSVARARLAYAVGE